MPKLRNYTSVSKLLSVATNVFFVINADILIRTMCAMQLMFVVSVIAKTIKTTNIVLIANTTSNIVARIVMSLMSMPSKQIAKRINSVVKNVRTTRKNNYVSHVTK